MGINPYNRPEQKKEESDLDKIMKGLQIANAVTNIYTDIDKVSQLKEDRALRQEQLNREKETFKRQGEKHDWDRAEFKAKEKRGFVGAKDPLVQELQEARLEQLKKDKEPKDNQFKAATFGGRAQDAELTMQQLKTEGFNRADRSTAFWNKIAPESYESQPYRKQKNAELNFLTAVLRKESGATITPDELAMGEKVYFDRAGDSDEVKAQKAQTRLRAIEALNAEGAPAQEMIAKRSQGRAPIAAGVGLKPPKMTQEDLKALEWAKKNPQDPRAQAIFKANGM